MTHDPDLIRYYDQDAQRRDEAELSPGRVAWRQEFVELLVGEGRHRIIEFGSGPGHDGRGFAGAGLDWIGMDLSIAHAGLATRHGVLAVVGSLFHPPVRLGFFDAAWSMSTLVHVPDVDFDGAMAAMVATLRPGAPIALGLWGGRDWERHRAEDLFDPPRFYSLRSHERARAMLGRHGTVERFDVHDPGHASGWEYQLAIVRTPR